jgi:DNA modification methylase
MKKKAAPPSKPGANAFKIAPALLPLATLIDTLKPDAANANEHPAENLRAIKNSLQEFGQLKPIVITPDRIIRAGNGTWLAAKEMGAKVIAVVQIPSELVHRAEEFSLADNQTARLSRWNPAKLKEAIDRLKANGVATEPLGFNEKELQATLARIKAAAGHRESNWDTAAPGRARTKAGDLWALGEHRLLVADCREPKAIHRLMGTRKAQCVFTDPPYGVDYEDSKGRTIKNDALGRDTLASFLTGVFKAAVEAAASDAAFYIWHANATRADFEHAMKAAGLVERQCLIWAKPALVLGHADYQWNHEPCFYASKAGTRPAFYAGRAETTLWRVAVVGANDTATALGPGILVSDGNGAEMTLTAGASSRKLRHMRVEKGKPLLLSDARGQGTVWEVSRDTVQAIHPNQKPVELALRAIENSTQPGQAVLDIFAGSGSTLMAAEHAGRAAFCIERDPRWADGILARWEKATKTKAEKL